MGSRNSVGRCILLAPGHSLAVAHCLTGGGARAQLAKQMTAYDLEFPFMSLFCPWVWIFLANGVDSRASLPRVKFWLYHWLAV